MADAGPVEYLTVLPFLPSLKRRAILLGCKEAGHPSCSPKYHAYISNRRENEKYFRQSITQYLQFPVASQFRPLNMIAIRSCPLPLKQSFTIQTFPLPMRNKRRGAYPVTKMLRLDRQK